MSRNYELSQLMEKNSALLSSPLIEAPSSVLDERQLETSRPLASDVTLGLVQRIFLDQSPDPPRVVVFAAIDHRNGCSQIAVSVAETLAANFPGGVCLVEGNFRSPVLPRMLGTTNYRGLTDALQQPGEIRSFMKPLRNESIWVLTSGPIAAHSPGLLASERMRARIAELRREFDCVIIDAPPVSRYADVISLSKMSDGIVLVLEAESTRREAARIAVENLRASRIPVLGAVLNKRTFPIPDLIYNWL
jgi:polysaccharide biosynthesis transport protein